MADNLNYDALGAAVTQRREQLHLSIRDASDLSRRIDEEVNSRPKRLPGIGDTTWTKVGQGVEAKRYAHNAAPDRPDVALAGRDRPCDPARRGPARG